MPVIHIWASPGEETAATGARAVRSSGESAAVDRQALQRVVGVAVTVEPAPEPAGRVAAR